MDDSARGIAAASLTLQSSLLQALVGKGVLSPADALEVVDNSLTGARICLEGLREGLVEAIAAM
jgi:hypothetical protein